jgi:hypothetical protein
MHLPNQTSQMLTQIRPTSARRYLDAERKCIPAKCHASCRLGTTTCKEGTNHEGHFRSLHSALLTLSDPPSPARTQLQLHIKRDGFTSWPELDQMHGRRQGRGLAWCVTQKCITPDKGCKVQARYAFRLLGPCTIVDRSGISSRTKPTKSTGQDTVSPLFSGCMASFPGRESAGSGSSTIIQ